MFRDLPVDEGLIPRLPLPLAQLYRRAHNAKTALERHLTAFYLWEASLKLLASVAVVEYAHRPEGDPRLAERLQNLARPALGHWWEFVRLLVPYLADHGDAAFGQLRDILLGRTRDDMPRAAGLDAALRETLEGRSGQRTTVRLTELFDRLVRYRNQFFGHGAPGQLKDDFNERMAKTLHSAMGEILGRVDVLAGRRLLYVAEVRQLAGVWLIQRFELKGEGPRRIPSLEVPLAQAKDLPMVERVYLDRILEGDSPVAASFQLADPAAGKLETRRHKVVDDESRPNLETHRLLHPLLLFEVETGETLYYSARAGRKRTEYLSYTSGRTVDRPDLGFEQRELLGRVLGIPVSAEQVACWVERSQSEEPPLEEQSAGPSVRTLGEYELLSELGRGGMGVVYRAWQPSLGRQVALKSLLRGGDAKSEARFRREIRALGNVEHSHLVKIFTSGSEGDHWFYAMELVEGVPLSSVCDTLQNSTANITQVDLPTFRRSLSMACARAREKEKQFSASTDSGNKTTDSTAAHKASVKKPPEPEEGNDQDEAHRQVGKSFVRHIVSLIAQVADATHALHEAGIIHRDVKPGNIMVSADGQNAFLMDLGLAQLADDMEGRLTRTRQFVGTLRYASPEQVLAVGRLDRRTDVYSLGATLWELLTLTPMFAANENTPMPELMKRIQFDEPERLRALHPGIARDLEAIVHKCLEKAPQNRYATAHDLARDLRRFLNFEPVRARPVTRLERSLKWVRRHRAITALYVLILLVTVLGGLGGFIFFLYMETQTARNDAVAASKGREIALIKVQEARKDAEDALSALKIAHKETEDALNKAEESAKNEMAAGLRLKEALAQMELFANADRFKLTQKYLFEEAWDHAYEFLELCPRKLRLWEWHFLKQQLPLHKNLRGHASRITMTAFSPDGLLLASSSDDKTVNIWDIEGDRLLYTLRHEGAGSDRYQGYVYGIAFHPAGKILASARSRDNNIKLWDLTTGKELPALPGHTDEVKCLAFSSKGILASAGVDRTIRLWDAAAGKEIHVLKGHEDEVQCLAFSADGKWLASAGREQAVNLWNMADLEGKPIVLKGHKSQVTALAFRPDGKQLASGGWDHKILLWDLATRELSGDFAGHASRVNSLAYSPDGRYLASGSDDQTLKLWDVIGKQVVRAFSRFNGLVQSVAFSPDGRMLASGGSDKTIKLWNMVSAPPLFLHGHADSVTSVAFSADGQWLASASFDTTIRLWNARTRQFVRSLTGHASTVEALAFSPDSKQLASSSEDGAILVWDVGRIGNPSYQDGKLKPLPLNSHRGFVVGLAFHPKGKLLASAGNDYSIKLWDLDRGEELRSIPAHGSHITGLAFSPDGRFLASASADRSVKLWDPKDGKELASLPHADAVLHACFSPDSTLLAAACNDRTVKLWSVDEPEEEPRSLGGHLEPVSRVAFSNDGKRLVSRGFDQTLRMWDLETGKDLLLFRLPVLRDERDKLVRTHNYHPQGLAFSADGKSLACATGNDIQLWTSLDSRLWEKRWREHEVRACEDCGQWFAALHHLDHLVGGDPDDFDLHLRKGLAVLGAGDDDAFCKNCERMQSKFGQVHDEAMLFAMASVLVLRPGALADFQPLVQCLQKALPADAASSPGRVTYLAALLRAGAYDQLLGHFQEKFLQGRNALALLPWTPSYSNLAALAIPGAAPSAWQDAIDDLLAQETPAAAQVLVALAYHKLKQDRVAHRWFKQALRRWDEEASRHDKTSVSSPWQHPLRWQVLRQECETALGIQPTLPRVDAPRRPEL